MSYTFLKMTLTFFKLPKNALFKKNYFLLYFLNKIHKKMNLRLSLIYILIAIITTEPDTINLVADVPTSSTENQHNKKNKTKNYHNYNNAYEVRKVGDTLDLFGKNKKMSETYSLLWLHEVNMTHLFIFTLNVSHFFFSLFFIAIIRTHFS